MSLVPALPQSYVYRAEFELTSEDLENKGATCIRCKTSLEWPFWIEFPGGSEMEIRGGMQIKAGHLERRCAGTKKSGDPCNLLLFSGPWPPERFTVIEP